MNPRAALLLSGFLLLLPGSILAKENLPERYRGPGIDVRGPGDCAPEVPVAPAEAEEEANLYFPGELFAVVGSGASGDEHWYT